jgi:biotin carboxyl carrier protein
MKYITTIDGKEFEIEVLDDKHVMINGKKLEVDFASVGGQPVYSMLLDGKSYEAYINPDEEQWQVLLRGRLFPTSVEDEREKRLRAASGGTAQEGGEFTMKAPMPGMVVAVLVEENQQVEKGQVLLILESMKMQNELKAPRSGIVSRIRVKERDSVEQKAALLSIG